MSARGSLDEVMKIFVADDIITTLSLESVH